MKLVPRVALFHTLRHWRARYSKNASGDIVKLGTSELEIKAIR
jgi:hypothetical protein